MYFGQFIGFKILNFQILFCINESKQENFKLMDFESRHFKSLDLKFKSKSKYPNATLGFVWYSLFKNSFLVCKPKMRIPLNFSLFRTLVFNFNLKNGLIYLVGLMPFFKITWTCFGLFFFNRIRFHSFIIVAI